MQKLAQNCFGLFALATCGFTWPKSLERKHNIIDRKDISLCFCDEHQWMRSFSCFYNYFGREMCQVKNPQVNLFVASFGFRSRRASIGLTDSHKTRCH